jgi:hypothetical protein
MFPAIARAKRPARLRRAGRDGGRRCDGGFAIFLILIVLVVGSVAVFLNGLNTASASMKLRRDEGTAAALKQAKEGLIAWAATRAADGPGHLPCPDRKEINQPLAGYQESTCVGAPARVGRLPFRTLGLPDLRDASGERLWYALSAGFRDGAGVPVNSDTLGTLTVEGVSVATGVVAIIFAPGAAVGTQTRAVADSDDPSKYLESVNPYLADIFLASTGCAASACPLPFSGGAAVPSQHNDQFIVITHEDLFRVVEAVVQRRIEREIAPRLSNPGGAGPEAGYFELWGADVYADARRGFFPFAAPYDDPARATDDYRGALNQINGLLPVSTNTSTWVAWSNVVVAKSNALSTGTLDTIPAATCAPSSCTFQYTCVGACNFPDNGLDITVTARLRNAASSLVLPTGITASGDWLVTPGNPPVSVARSFDTASGDLLFTLTFKLPPTAVPMTNADIPFPTPAFSALTAPASWFVANGWHRQTYYAISDGFRLRPDLGTRVIDPLNGAYAASPPCAPEPTPPACIRVDNGPAKARAVLVLAGRHLAGGARTYTVANYFEKKNADAPSAAVAPVNQVFERGLRAGDFNDRVVVVSPEPPGP